MRTLSALCIGLLLASTACDSSKDATKDGAKKADAKPAAADKKDAKNEPAKEEPAADAKPEAEPEPAKEEPKLEALALGEWGVNLRVPAGTKLGELSDNQYTIDSEAGCGVEIEVIRHKAGGSIVEEMFKNSTGPSGNPNDEFPIKDKTDTGYKIKHSWEPPMGKVWSSEVGITVGDHFYMCGAGGMMGADEEKQVDCAMKACETLALVEG